MTSDATSAQPQSADKDIRRGLAKVPWAAPNGTLQAGWALPGGARTQDHAAATDAAEQIAQLMRDNASHARSA